MRVVGARHLIGRAAELESVDHFVERVGVSPASLVIDGDAGIGKTSVWRAAVERAVGAGIRVLRSAPAESEQRLPLGGLTDLLSEVTADELAILPNVQRHALEIALLRVEPSGQLPDQRTLAVAAAGLLRSLAARRPVLVAVDDAQWLDESTIAVVAYAVRRLDDRSAGVLLAVRGEPDPRMLDLVAGVPPDHRERCHLGPMPLAALHQLFLERLGRSFPRLVLVRIEQASGGNPFYALEIAHTLPAGPPTLTLGDRLTLPGTLGSLVEARIAELPASTRAALLLAAIAAEPTIDTLRRANAATPAALGPAVEAGIVTLDGRTIRFGHPLLAQAVVGAADASERRRAHATLARTARSEDARARHLGGATEGRHENVAAALEAAATSARDRGATIDASSLYERASELTPETRPDDALRRATLAADCLFVDLSEIVHSDAILERALATARPGPVRAEALTLRALLRYYHGDTSGAVRLADQAVAEVAAAATPEERVRRARILGRAAFLVMQLDLERGFGLVQEAIQLLEPLPDGVDSDLIANVLLLHASAALSLCQGLHEDEIERGRSLITEAGRSWEHEGADGISFGLARQTDDLERAIAMTHELIRAKAGPAGDDPFNLVQLSGLQVQRGDLAGARASADAAAEGYAREGADVFPAWRLRGLALVAAHEDRHDEARRLAAEGLELAERSGDLVLQVYHHHILGFVALSAGDPRGANAELSEAARCAAASGTRHPGRFKLDGDRIEAALAVGDLDGARSIVASLEQVSAVAPTPWTRAIGARGRGLVQAAERDLEAARGTLERALVEHDALPMPVERARTLLALGQVHRRLKEKRLADQRLRDAIAGFEAIGELAWAERARVELGRVGLRPTAPAQLTQTERRVATLAAAGLSSRQIGEIAFLAPKTVGNVLGRVYEKLGIHSRAELGALLGSSAGLAIAAVGEGSREGTTGDRSG